MVIFSLILEVHQRIPQPFSITSASMPYPSPPNFRLSIKEPPPWFDLAPRGNFFPFPCPFRPLLTPNPTPFPPLRDFLERKKQMWFGLGTSFITRDWSIISRDGARVIAHGMALWFSITKNWDVTSRPLTCLLACLPAPLTHSLARHCSTLLALLGRSIVLICSFVYSLTRKLTGHWMIRFPSIKLF